MRSMRLAMLGLALILPAHANVIWQQSHGSWKVSMESTRLGANAPISCNVQTFIRIGNKETLLRASVVNPNELLLTMVYPPYPVDVMQQNGWILTMNGRDWNVPADPKAEKTPPLVSSVVANNREGIVRFMQGLAVTRQFVLRVPEKPDILVTGVQGGREAFDAFNSCLQRHLLT